MPLMVVRAMSVMGAAADNACRGNNRTSHAWEVIIMAGCGCPHSDMVSNAIVHELTTPNHRGLALLLSAAARHYVTAIRSFARADKAEMLLGEGAGGRDLAEAEMHHESFRHLSGQAQRMLHLVAQELEADHQAALDEFLSGGGLQRLSAGARTRVLHALIDSESPTSVAAEAAGRLDEIQARIAQLRTADDAIGFIDQELSEFAATSTTELHRMAMGGSCIAWLTIKSLVYTFWMVFQVICADGGCGGESLFGAWLAHVCPY
jgi:hypothetical protein